MIHLNNIYRYILIILIIVEITFIVEKSECPPDLKFQDVHSPLFWNPLSVSLSLSLCQGHEMTSIGLLLGVSSAKLGTMDMSITRLLSIHIPALLPPTSTELDVPHNVQVWVSVPCLYTCLYIWIYSIYNYHPAQIHNTIKLRLLSLLWLRNHNRNDMTVRLTIRSPALSCSAGCCCNRHRAGVPGNRTQTQCWSPAVRDRCVCFKEKENNEWGFIPPLAFWRIFARKSLKLLCWLGSAQNLTKTRCFPLRSTSWSRDGVLYGQRVLFTRCWTGPRHGLPRGNSHR